MSKRRRANFGSKKKKTKTKKTKKMKGDLEDFLLGNKLLDMNFFLSLFFTSRSLTIFLFSRERKKVFFFTLLAFL